MSTLRPADFAKILRRSFLIQSAWNYERMLSLGYCSCLSPFIRHHIAETERSGVLKRALAYFNTHPYMANWIIGAVMRLEEQNIASDKIDRFKKLLSGSLAAVGDQLFWTYLKAISVVIGTICALYSEFLGIAVFLIVYNAPHLYVRVRGLKEGYLKGFDLVKTVSLQRFRPLLDHLSKFASLTVGILAVALAGSDFVKRAPDFLAFVGGGVVMFLFIKWRIPVPAAVGLLVAIAAVSGLVLF